MSSVVISGDTSGAITLAAPAVAGTYTQTLPMITGTLGTLNSGTAVASTSGTSIDFTSLPANIRRITVMFSGVSLSGASSFLIQLGTSSGPTTSGYAGGGARSGSSTISTTNFTAGFGYNNTTAATTYGGNTVLTNVSGNIWACSGVISGNTTESVAFTAGNISLGGTLDRVRITTVNGTDTFDAGSINILYE